MTEARDDDVPIGFEKRFNAKLSMPKRAFADALTAEIPPPKADMAGIFAANLCGFVPAVARA